MSKQAGFVFIAFPTVIAYKWFLVSVSYFMCNCPLNFSQLAAVLVGGGVLHHEVPDVCILWINGSLGAKQKTGACPSPVLHSDD